MPRRAITKALDSAQRVVAALALAGMLLPWAPGPALPARADDEPIVRDHRADERLEFVIKKIRILDDQDPGEGTFEFSVKVWEVTEGCDQGELTWFYCRTEIATSAAIKFDAGGFGDEQETVTLNRVFPAPGDWTRDVGPGFGIPVLNDRSYGWEIRGIETDLAPNPDDDMGDLAGEINQQMGWGLGTWNERGWVNYSEFGIFGADFCVRTGPIGCRPAYFRAEYEVRRAPLADLRPTEIEIKRASGKPDEVCATVLNAGSKDAGPFWILAYLDNQEPPITILDATASDYAQPGYTYAAAGLTAHACTELANPLPRTGGRHRLAVVADARSDIIESDETNNRLEQGFVFSEIGQAVADSPNVLTQDTNADSPRGPIGVIAEPLVRQPLVGTVNLEVKVIRVRGNEPSGVNDCDPGQNDVTVVVKNEGTGVANSFLVRLMVGNQTKEKTATDLGASGEANVQFDDLVLAAGQHKLIATANQTSTAAPKQDDGKLEVTVSCANE